MYDINTQIGMIYLPHEPKADKLIRIRENMMVNGWVGRPVILIDGGDHKIAITGCHRLAAAQGLDLDINAIYLPDDLSQDHFDLIDAANDDADRLAVLEQIQEDRGDIAEIVAAMQAEVAE